MSAVKNLRAMFEQKGEMSPPDRGRSPAISPSESPRPLNKIKTSFIAVEKSGRLGLQPAGSNDSETPIQRTPGGLGDIASPFVPSEKPNVVDLTMEKAPAAASPGASRTPAESPKANPTVQSPTDSAHETRAQNVEPSGSAPEEPKRLEIDGATGTSTTGSGSKSAEKTKAPNRAGTVTDKETVPSKPEPRTAPKTTTKSNLPPLSTSAANKTAAKAGKSPITAQTPKMRSPTAASSQTSAKTATPKPAAKTAKSSLGSSLNKKPAILAPSPVITGSSKPKVKSPTRPIALPERLTTHTAASGSKLGNARAQSQSRERGPTPASRSSSRVRVPAPATSAAKTATSNLKRQNSTNSRPRPSLGAPVKQAAKDHPPTKKEKEVDEGFLARMMRPTAASASKTAEKVVTSPPRKSSATPGPAAKRSLSKPRTKKPATKSAAPSAATTPKQSRASSVAAKVEQVATAEEAVNIAKATDEEMPLPAVTETPQEVSQPVEEAAEVTQEVSAPPSEAEAAAAPQTPTSDVHDVKEEMPAQETEAVPSPAAEVADAVDADIKEKEEEKSASTPEPKHTSDS
ncbi:hypothetical protein SMACR_00497 [Sordaria macrospora]|uniref:WGS project CABT00000000 data, contig 2.1 n=2 Tax=Sordaria macrospora TaxID=5147 RepID=F7VLA2_SORMK|nr:uncharacterized protein SMAC_00497 [Sordaria macrospora k-hell]KAA8635400.1 hypothetical protein SMACR_00497 [Sordaria macrospora]WPJ59247.1 hypothetical protein SMAC4_00497 [Sordaria macrospora]CCC06279.1 unnamed protein product [Sordaria macrospora k-hell]